MKTLSKIAMLVCIALTLQAQPKHVYVPDVNFRKALITHAINYGIAQGTGDTIVVPNIATVDTLEITQKSIKNFQGIEEFTALQYLNCNGNELITLDVSKNVNLQELSCNSNQLITLDVSKNTALKYLQCSGNDNQFTTIDVSHNLALISLWCGGSKFMTLDVSKNVELRGLTCYASQVKVLDVSKNILLEYLQCHNNQLTTLDISKNTVLKEFRCDMNPLLTTVYVWAVPFPLDVNGTVVKDSHTQFVLAPTTPVKEKQSLIVSSTQLDSNYPNPFNPTTTIHYQIANVGIVNLKVYDVLGKEISTLVNEKQNVGKYTINFDASHLPAGIYFYRLQSGEFVETKKMVLLK